MTIRFSIFAVVAVSFCNQLLAQSDPDVDAIRTVLVAQQDAWNQGDYEGFMDGYWNSDSLTFASGGTFNRGWQTTLDNYKLRYPDRAAMGTLTFTLYEIRLLSESDGFVFGRFELERENDHPSGIFTLLMKKFENGWKVVFDHTSSVPPSQD